MKSDIPEGDCGHGLFVESVRKVHRVGWRRERIVALDDVSLFAEWGQVVGIAGPNGAGKSTLFDLLLGFAYPTSGKLAVSGTSPRRFVETEGVCYVPEVVQFPRMQMTGAELLAVSRMLQSGRTTSDWVGYFGLEKHLRAPIGTLSKGVRQRLWIASALTRNARLILFDEPCTALDPYWDEQLRQCMLERASAGALIIVASHDMRFLERVSDVVHFLNVGRRCFTWHRGDARQAAPNDEWRIEWGAATGESQGSIMTFTGTPTDLSSMLLERLSDGARLVECVPARSPCESLMHRFRES